MYFMSNQTLLELKFFHTTGKMNFYVFFLFSIIQKVLKKHEKEQVKEIIILPLFTAQAWFTRLLRILVSDTLTSPA